MKKALIVSALIAFLLTSCRDLLDAPAPIGSDLPPGTPVMLTIPFGADDLVKLDVTTKAGTNEVNETNVHDLYVLIFNKVTQEKIYGRYFNYDHRRATLAEFNSKDNECWFVDNRSISDLANNTGKKTRGAVKISTVACDNAVLVVLANVANAIMELDQTDEIDRLNQIQNLDELRGLKVTLEQDVVNRKNLFLMMGTLGYDDGKTINTGSMRWNQTVPPAEDDEQYNDDWKVTLRNVDAKVKFRVKVNTQNISAVTPVYWQVCNTPGGCYLFPDFDDGKAPSDIHYFNSQQAYFEETEMDGVDEYHVFTFYVLENRFTPKKSASQYHDREKQLKSDTGEGGYKGPTSPTYGDHFVENREWEYANDLSTYVLFDLVLTLTANGISGINPEDSQGIDINNALTSDAIFTVHLGDFTNKGVNDYNTERGCLYTYNVTVQNTTSIYAEVKRDDEKQPGQEGFILLTDESVVNADAHYEYHQLSFKYRAGLDPRRFTWYVKTPFGEGGPTASASKNDNGNYEYPAEGLDYLWVKFGVNDLDGDHYTQNRHAYPGIDAYRPDWEPDPNNPGSHPELMDITQLIQFIFAETAKETQTAGSSAFKGESDGNKYIRVTAFIDEYYYEKHPITGNVDPQLWRQFVNAKPREMHILSDAQSSRDRQSDVILSSHSIIQQSIQTIYNTYAADLNTLWGTEHLDENRKNSDGWPYWPGATDASTGRAGDFNTAIGKENGRLNTAYIWDLYSSTAAGGSDRQQVWDTFLDYEKQNNIPELRTDYQGMAYSCLNRNRDNDGNGVIDRNEVRWYLAAAEQLVGMWIGNESLSTTARLYQPAAGQWRAHVVSSSGKRVCWAEEGSGATEYGWDFDPGRHTWNTITDASAGESVRCLRNIGTYVDGGETKDISYAPYDQEIQRWFTLDHNSDGSYTFYFDRLNPKSMRELSEGELPYHDQFSVTNSVYKKMTTQRPADDVGTFEARLDTINTYVTREGYNKFCPPGYRFPNQSEMVLMSLYLPNSYFDKDKDGNTYTSGSYMPTRTYYDRGIYGSKKDDPLMGAGKTFENNKVGWGYSRGDHKPHCANRTEIMYHSRCVKDDDVNGSIDGEINIGTTMLHPGDTWNVNLHFSSLASSFVSTATFLLCYTTGAGSYHERSIPLDHAPGGLQYMAVQQVQIPTLEDFGLEATDLMTDKKNMKFKIILRNTAGITATFETPFELRSHMGGKVEVLEGYDPGQGFPIRIDATSVEGYPITSVKLRWKAEGESAYSEQTVTVSDPTQTSGSYMVYWQMPEWTSGEEVRTSRKYYFSALVESGTADMGIAGRKGTADDAEMEFIKINYNPNPNDPDNPWSYTHQPPASSKWYAQAITELNFAAGDFIDAYLDVTNCTFDPKPGNPSDKSSLGMDNLLSFGPSTKTVDTNKQGIEWAAGNGNVILYYPAKNGNNYNLQIAILSSSITRVQPFNLEPDKKLKILIKRDLDANEGRLLVNDVIPDWRDDINKAGKTDAVLDSWAAAAQGKLNDLTNRSTVYVASTEGNHRSRAFYKYVRVVRK